MTKIRSEPKPETFSSRMMTTVIAVALFFFCIAILVFVDRVIEPFFGTITFVGATAVLLIAGFVSSAPLRRKLAVIPLWQKSLGLIAALFAAGLLWSLVH